MVYHGFFISLVFLKVIDINSFVHMIFGYNLGINSSPNPVVGVFDLNLCNE